MKIKLVWNASVAAAPAGFKAAVQTAADMIGAALGDAVTINISVGWGEVGGVAFGAGASEAAGGPASGVYVSYATLRQTLTAHASSTFDAAAYATLATAQDPNGGGVVAVWRAQAKALGLSPADDAALDGEIGFGAGVPAANWIGVALHEITHAMGRTSGAPSYGVEDLFRYVAPGVHRYDGGSGGTQYLSVDGGATRLATYSPTSDYGDWVNDSYALNDAFDAYYSASTRQSLSATDLNVLDLIGFRVGVSGLTTAQALAAYAANPAAAPMTIADAAAIVGANLAALQTLAAYGAIASIFVTDGQAVHVAPAALTADAAALGEIAGLDLAIDSGAAAISCRLADNVRSLAVNGSGAATLVGGANAATIVGGTGNDWIYAGSGAVYANGGLGDDVLVSGAGDDVLVSGGGFDYLIAGAGADTLVANGGSASDVAVMLGGAGAVSMQGGAGVNYFYAGAGAATMQGGTGINIFVDHAETVGAVIHGGAGMNYVYAGDHGDVATGGAATDVFVGGAGADTFEGGGGVNYAWGGGGSDVFIFDPTRDDILVVQDFGVGGAPDRLRLTHSPVASLSALNGLESYYAAIDTTVITFSPGHAIWLTGVSPAELTAANLSFA